MGNYTHFTNSLHIYEKHFKMLDTILKNAKENVINCTKISCASEVDSLLGRAKFKVDYMFERWLRT